MNQKKEELEARVSELEAIVKALVEITANGRTKDGTYPAAFKDSFDPTVSGVCPY